MFTKNKVFAYENSDGDKGIIIAKSIEEAIKNGFEKGVISIEDDYAGCLGACCRIGDNAFYFIDAEDAYLTKEEYWKSYTLNMTINMIFNVLKNVEAAEENGIDYAELAYYEAVLTTNFFL